MDGDRFDSFARSWAAGSRRRLLRGLAGGLAVAVAGGARLAAPNKVGAQAGDICGPSDVVCVWPETPQECCAPGYVCTSRKVCCQPDRIPCGGSPGSHACCCDPGQGETCNPAFDANPDSGAQCCIQSKLKITQLKLNDIDDKTLQYLSAAPHTYFGGNTRVHGTITVVGAKTDRLTDVVLEVLQGGSVVARGQLDPKARSTLLTAFGPKETIKIAKSKLLFNIPSSELGNIDGSANGNLTLRVRAISQDEGETTKDFGAVALLVRYTNGNRYGGRDEKVGGDDWVKPSVKAVLEHFPGLTWGDMSNMNGGKFKPHKGHQNGQEADGWFAGYNARNAATAQTIIGHLNDATHGSRIAKVFVTYSASPCDVFCKAITGVTLDDGRRAIDVIRPVSGHGTHFHWNVSP